MTQCEARSPVAGASVWSVLGILLVLAVASGCDFAALRDAQRTIAADVIEPRGHCLGNSAGAAAAICSGARRPAPAFAVTPRQLPRHRDIRHGGLPMPRAPDRLA